MQAAGGAVVALRRTVTIMITALPTLLILGFPADAEDGRIALEFLRIANARRRSGPSGQSEIGEG